MKIDGMVEKPLEIGIDDLIRQDADRGAALSSALRRGMGAWPMPWSGFPFAKLVELAKPLSSAKYVEMETFQDPTMAPGQRQTWYPWPYIEGLTIEEAANELAFMVTGVYGKPAPKQIRRADPPRGAVEIRLQVGQVDRALHLHRQAAEELLGSAAGGRIRLLGQCESGGPSSALEPGDRGGARHGRARADAAVQRLRRIRRRSLQGIGERAAVCVRLFFGHIMSEPSRKKKKAGPGGVGL